MQLAWNRLARVARWTVAVVIVGAVIGHFSRLLSRSELWQNPPSFQPVWLVGTTGGYLLAFLIWGGYWTRLLRATGSETATWRILKAYFVSQLGKYVPGKALAIVIRVMLIRHHGVRPEVAAITATYETLTVMAAGAMLTAVLMPFVQTEAGQLWWKILALLVLVGIPILPDVFNRLAYRAARPFLSSQAPPIPRLASSHLVSGVIQASIGWVFLGCSLLTLLRAFGHEGLSLLTCTMYVAFSYVAGFLTLPAPGGLGVREALLQQFLAKSFLPSLGESQGEAFAVVIAITLRFWWTVTEVGLAGLALAFPWETRRE
jgi:uncharacterized membrane protein YbhN (UPF0104 family)